MVYNIRLKANLENSISHSSELEEQMGDITFDKLTIPARNRLALHRETGDHKITQTKGRVDHFVNLEGEASLAVEVGHHHKKTGEWVEGIGVLDSTILHATSSFRSEQTGGDDDGD